MAAEKKPPGDRGHLHRLLRDQAEKQGMPEPRLQRWLNAMVVTAVLDRVRHEDGEPVFLLKGGVAMELRLRLRARATKDFDTAFRVAQAEALDRLDEAIREPWGHFSITRDAPENIPNTEALRIRLRIAYKGRDWGSVSLEMAEVEGDMGKELDRVPATPLDPMGLKGPDTVACVSLRYQVAQKLHACTEVFDTGRENDRFRDVMDILLVEELLREVGLSNVRKACIDIFTTRGKHSWPPTVTVYESWREPFRALAIENGFEPEDIDEAVERLGALIKQIDQAHSQ